MSDPQQPRPSTGVPPLMRAGLILAAITIIADQASKWLLQDMLLKQPVIEVIPGFFNLVMVWNRGISFGMLGGAGALPPWVLSAIAVAICVALLLYMLVSADFSVVYVAEHVNLQLPVFYRLTSLWAGQAAGLSTAESKELRELRKKNRELEQTIEILKAATSFFVRESDPRHH